VELLEDIERSSIGHSVGDHLVHILATEILCGPIVKKKMNNHTKEIIN